MSLLGTFLGWITTAAHWHGPGGIPVRLAQHVLYCAEALGLAGLVAVPLGLLTGHTGRGGLLASTLANLARALPTLGVLTLLAVATSFGVTSTAPVIIALVVLALPQILLNTYEGVRGVDPQVLDGARGMGMTGWQLLARVEVPIAAPLILQGLRTAAFQVVATATIAAYVGVGGLGRFIIDGLAEQDYAAVVGGAVLVAALALLTEAGFGLLARLVLSPGVRAGRSR